MADAGGIQLLPQTRKKLDIKVPGENRMLYIGGALFALVLVVSGFLYFYQSSLNQQLTDADAQLLALEQSRNKQAENNLLTLSKQITLISQLLKAHLYWSTGFSKLEANLQPNVQFKSISANLSDNSVTFRAVADNYATIAKQLSALVSDDTIQDVTLGGVNVLTNGKLDFSSKIQFKKDKFLTQ